MAVTAVIIGLLVTTVIVLVIVKLQLKELNSNKRRKK